MSSARSSPSPVGNVTMPSQSVYNTAAKRPKTSGSTGSRGGAAVNLRYEFDARRINTRPTSSSMRSPLIHKPMVVTNSKNVFIGGTPSDEKDSPVSQYSVQSGFSPSPEKWRMKERPGSPSSRLSSPAAGDVGELGTIEENANIGTEAVTLTAKRDQAALQIGRLILGTIIAKPEVTTADQLARFFFDQWLYRNGSNVKQADVMSIDLMCEMQKYHSISQSIHVKEGIEQVDIPEEGVSEDENVTDRIIKAQTLVGKAAFKALQRMAKEFRSSSPILDEIMKSLSPLVFELREEELKLLEDDEGVVDFDNHDLLTWKELSKSLIERARRSGQLMRFERERTRKVDELATNLHYKMCELEGHMQEEDRVRLTYLTNQILDICHEPCSTNGDDTSRQIKTAKNFDMLQSSRLLENKPDMSKESSQKEMVVDHALDLMVMDSIVEEEDDPNALRRDMILYKLREFFDHLREKVDLLRETDYTSEDNLPETLLKYMTKFLNEQTRGKEKGSDVFDLLEFLSEFMPPLMDDYVQLKALTSNKFGQGEQKSSTTMDLRMSAMRAQAVLADKKYRHCAEEKKRLELELAQAKNKIAVLTEKATKSQRFYEHNFGQLTELKHYVQEKQREWAANTKYNLLLRKHNDLREQHDMLLVDTGARDHLYALMERCREQEERIRELSEFDKEKAKKEFDDLENENRNIVAENKKMLDRVQHYEARERHVAELSKDLSMTAFYKENFHKSQKEIEDLKSEILFGDKKLTLIKDEHSMKTVMHDVEVQQMNELYHATKARLAHAKEKIAELDTELKILKQTYELDRTLLLERLQRIREHDLMHHEDTYGRAFHIYQGLFILNNEKGDQLSVKSKRIADLVHMIDDCHAKIEVLETEKKEMQQKLGESENKYFDYIYGSEETVGKNTETIKGLETELDEAVKKHADYVMASTERSEGLSMRVNELETIMYMRPAAMENESQTDFTLDDVAELEQAAQHYYDGKPLAAKGSLGDQELDDMQSQQEAEDDEHVNACMSPLQQQLDDAEGLRDKLSDQMNSLDNSIDLVASARKAEEEVNVHRDDVQSSMNDLYDTMRMIKEAEEQKVADAERRKSEAAAAKLEAAAAKLRANKPPGAEGAKSGASSANTSPSPSPAPSPRKSRTGRRKSSASSALTSASPDARGADRVERASQPRRSTKSPSRSPRKIGADSQSEPPERYRDARASLAAVRAIIDKKNQKQPTTPSSAANHTGTDDGRRSGVNSPRGDQAIVLEKQTEEDQVQAMIQEAIEENFKPRVTVVDAETQTEFASDVIVQIKRNEENTNQVAEIDPQSNQSSSFESNDAAADEENRRNMPAPAAEIPSEMSSALSPPETAASAASPAMDKQEQAMDTPECAQRKSSNEEADKRSASLSIPAPGAETEQSDNEFVDEESKDTLPKQMPDFSEPEKIIRVLSEECPKPSDFDPTPASRSPADPNASARSNPHAYPNASPAAELMSATVRVPGPQPIPDPANVPVPQFAHPSACGDSLPALPPELRPANRPKSPVAGAAPWMKAEGMAQSGGRPTSPKRPISAKRKLSKDRKSVGFYNSDDEFAEEFTDELGDGLDSARDTDASGNAGKGNLLDKFRRVAQEASIAGNVIKPEKILRPMMLILRENEKKIVNENAHLRAMLRECIGYFERIRDHMTNLDYEEASVKLALLSLKDLSSAKEKDVTSRPTSPSPGAAAGAPTPPKSPIPHAAKDPSKHEIKFDVDTFADVQSKLLEKVWLASDKIRWDLDQVDDWIFEASARKAKLGKTQDGDPLSVLADNKRSEVYMAKRRELLGEPGGDAEASASASRPASADGKSSEQDWRIPDVIEQMDEVFQKNIMKAGGWKAALYRKDGSIDLDMPTDSWADADRLKITEAKLMYLRRMHADGEQKFRQMMQRFKGQLRHLVRHNESEDLDPETAEMIEKMGLPLEPFQKLKAPSEKNLVKHREFSNEDLEDIESTVYHVTRSLVSLCGMSNEILPSKAEDKDEKILPRLSDSLSQQFDDADSGDENEWQVGVPKSQVKRGKSDSQKSIKNVKVGSSKSTSPTKRPKTAQTKEEKFRELIQRLDLASDVSADRVTAKEDLLRGLVTPNQRRMSLRPLNMRPTTTQTATGGKSFLDNHTHDGWRMVQHNRRISQAANTMHEYKHTHEPSQRPFGLAPVAPAMTFPPAPASYLMLSLQAIKDQRPGEQRIQLMKSRLIDAVGLVESKILFGRTLSGSMGLQPLPSSPQGPGSASMPSPAGFGSMEGSPGGRYLYGTSTSSSKNLDKRFKVEGELIDPGNPYMTSEQKQALFSSSSEVQNYARDINAKINRHLAAVTGLQTELSSLANRYDYSRGEFKNSANAFYDNSLLRKALL